MRIRTKTWARPELEVCDFFIQNPEENLGRWRQNFSRRQPLHLELGCGKGLLMAGYAPKNADINYIAVDISMDILGVARRNISAAYGEKPIENLLLTSFNIEYINTVFGEKDTVSRIYIYFCNPWSKERHKKRRLTHTRQLARYRDFLADDGEIYFKTDDMDLFNDSLNYFADAGFKINAITEDFFNSEYNSDNIMTEHEEKFVCQGIPIKFLIAKNQ